MSFLFRERQKYHWGFLKNYLKDININIMNAYVLFRQIYFFLYFHQDTDIEGNKINLI